MIRNRTPQTAEQWGHESMANYMTRGKWGIYRNFLVLFIQSAAVSVLVWLRYGIGRKVITLGSLIWSIWLMVALFLIFGTIGAGYSAHLTIPFIIIMLILGVVHIAEGSFNLQRRDGVPRPSFNPGRSIVWIILGRLLRWIRLAPEPGENPRFYQLDEWRWIRFGEPLMVLMIGTQLINMGYGAFGKYIEIAGICMFIHLQTMVNNYHEMIQSRWDAKDLGEGMQEDRAAIHRLPEKENQATMESMPNSREDFKRWSMKVKK